MLENSELMNDDSRSAVKLGQARNQDFDFDYAGDSPFTGRKFISNDDLSVNLGDINFESYNKLSKKKKKQTAYMRNAKHGAVDIQGQVLMPSFIINT